MFRRDSVRGTMQRRPKETILVVCLFFFLFVVLGGGLHLSPSGAFLASLTGTPLIVHVFNVWSRKSCETPSLHRGVTFQARDASSAEAADLVPRELRA
jgi:hypothetical protein